MGRGVFGEAMHKLDKPPRPGELQSRQFLAREPTSLVESDNDWQQFSYTLDGGSFLERCITGSFPKDEQT
jgi:hypothetical protein